MREVKVQRSPILVSEHAIALISIFIKPSDSFDEAWAWDYCSSHERQRRARAR